MLLPPRVDDYVGENNPVRVIDAYVEQLDLQQPGFVHADGDLTAGQPAYSPGALLKLYLYGYLMRVRSSRRLGAECYRNLEVMWWLAGLTPGNRTIASFRKTNANALKNTCRDFVLLCRELDLFGRELVAIDGSFFRGNGGAKGIFTENRLKRGLQRLLAGYRRGYGRLGAPGDTLSLILSHHREDPDGVAIRVWHIAADEVDPSVPETQQAGGVKSQPVELVEPAWPDELDRPPGPSGSPGGRFLCRSRSLSTLGRNNVSGHMTGQQLIAAHDRKENFFVGRGHGGLGGRLFENDLETGNWKTQKYETNRESSTPPGKNWFSLADFARRVRENQ